MCQNTNIQAETERCQKMVESGECAGYHRCNLYVPPLPPWHLMRGCFYDEAHAYPILKCQTPGEALQYLEIATYASVEDFCRKAEERNAE